jgi:hypothetical protein
VKLTAIHYHGKQATPREAANSVGIWSFLALLHADVCSIGHVPYEQDNILNQLHCKCSTHAERKMFDVKEKEPARIVSEIRDEAKLWIQVGVKDLALLVRPIVSE